VQSQHLIFDAIPYRQYQHRQAGMALPQALYEANTVESGQVKLKNNQVVTLFLLQRDQGFLSIVSLIDEKMLGSEFGAQKTSEGDVILDEKNAAADGMLKFRGKSACS
jgi:hypothetical protein